MSKLTWTAVLCLLVGCAMDPMEDDVIGETTQSSLCPSCGYNGLRKRAANYMPGSLNLGVLKGKGAATSAGINPLCGGGFNVNGNCPMSAGWDNWLMSDTSNTAWEIMTYMVKGAGDAEHGVRASNGVVYRGEVGLAPNALTGVWTAKDEQRITAATISYLNLNSGVPLCFRTEDDPGACSSADGWNYEELFAFGDVFRGTTANNIDWFVAGGRKGNYTYWSPAANSRVCGVDANVTCEVGLVIYTSSDSHCDTAGNTNIATRYARSCSSNNGKWWDFPVSVFLQGQPAPLPPGNPRPVGQIEY